MGFFTRFTARGTGIYNKLVRVLVLQLLFISAVTVLGVYAAATIVEKVMMRTALENEAQHFWEHRAVSPAHPVPNTDNLSGFLASSGNFSQVPETLRGVEPGFGRAPYKGNEPIVYVEDHGAERLYLVFDEDSVWSLSFYFGVVPLSLALVVIYVSAWFAYRYSYQTLSPLISLAQTMRRFDLSRHELDSLNLDDYIRPGVDDEVWVLAESLKEFTERLKRQLQREQEFTRDVSHELRTPLAVIRGSLEILQQQGGLTPLQARAVKRMQTTSQDMLALIESLLLLARDGTGGEDEPGPVVVNDLARLLIEQAEVTHNRDQHVAISLAEQGLLEVAAPAPVLGVVLGNLLHNACNYTHKGKVLLSVGPDSVTVQDTGEGIEASELERVQQAFQRSNEAVAGYGLGLDIVRRLCERYQWTLEIKSVAGKGTEVRVRFA